MFLAIVTAQYFIKASANQLIEIQVESSKREANEISKMLDFQLENKIDKEKIIQNLQNTISGSNSNTWFITVFNWSGQKICDPDITKIGQSINSNPDLLLSLSEKNNSDDLYELLINNSHKSDEYISEMAPYFWNVKENYQANFDYHINKTNKYLDIPYLKNQQVVFTHKLQGRKVVFTLNAVLSGKVDIIYNPKRNMFIYNN